MGLDLDPVSNFKLYLIKYATVQQCLQLRLVPGKKWLQICITYRTLRTYTSKNRCNLNNVTNKLNE